MGQVASFVVRKAKRFNVENRAHKVLEREKPTPAPKFESNLRDMERTMQMDPKFLENLYEKDMGLDKRLKSVYITSHDIEYTKKDEDVKRPLPTSRTTPDDFEYGFLEPKQAAIGRCTLRQAMEFIINHQDEPTHWTAQKIANDYKMKEALIESILQHFKSYKMYIPDKKPERPLLTERKAKLLTDNKNKPDF